MGKQKLVTEYNFDFLVWGIISPWPAHRIIWLLNDSFGYNLARIDDIEVRKEAGEVSYFPLYEYNNTRDHYFLELIHNRIPNDVFVPELKTVDYLFLVTGEPDFFDSAAFLQKIKHRHDT